MTATTTRKQKQSRFSTTLLNDLQSNFNELPAPEKQMAKWTTCIVPTLKSERYV